MVGHVGLEAQQISCTQVCTAVLPAVILKVSPALQAAFKLKLYANSTLDLKVLPKY